MKKLIRKGIITIIIIAIILAVLLLRGSEDAWIQNEKGEYVKHGMPSETPEKINKQQEIISEALKLYEQKKAEGVEFSSQCLGTVGTEEKYVVDIVHVPRSEEDNLPENQCQDYRGGQGFSLYRA